MRAPITILFIGVNPDGTQILDLTREAETIQRRLRQGALRDRFELVQRWKTAAEDLPGLLMEHEPQIVHVSGHGAHDGQLLFRITNGSAQPADAQVIAELFHLLRGVRCVVLSACHSSELARQVARHVDAVVGMAGGVRDEDAIAFAAGFYGALGHGQDVQAAFDLGRLQIGLSTNSSGDVCTLHVREGVDASTLRLHEIDAGASVDARWLETVRHRLLGTLTPPQLSGLPRAELRAGVTIDELFVGPLLEKCGKASHPTLRMLRRLGDELRQGLLIRCEDFERAWLGEVEVRGHEPEPESLKVVVRGGAGSGKSMLCRFLATRAAQKSKCLPLLLRVRDWADGSKRGLLEHIALEVTRISSMTISVGQLEVLCSTGLAQLFIDGFDELPPAEHQSLRDRLHGFAMAFPRVQILVTSRPALSGGSKLGLDGFVEFQLTPFTDDQLRLFADRWGARLINSSGESLWEALEAEPHAMHLARIPLFAALLAFIHARRGQLPRHRSQLYERCIDEMLVVWPEHHARQLPEPTGDHMRPILEDLALSIQSGRDDHFAALFGFAKVSFTDESLDERLLEGLARSRPEFEEGERRALRRRWRHWLLDDSGLLYESKPNRYAFTHLTMVEYLAARAAQRGHDAGDLAPLVEFVRVRYDYPTWRNTLLFLLDDRRDTELPSAVFEVLLDEEHHGDTLTFLLIMLGEGQRVSKELCVRLLEACLDSDGTQMVAVALYFGDIIAGEAHGEVLREWLTQRLASERGARLANLLECIPEDFPVVAHLERRSIDSLDPLALLDHETGGLGARGLLAPGLALIPNSFRLRWAFNRPVSEIVTHARRGLDYLPTRWPQRWIPALLSRAAWLSSLAIDDAQTSQWSIKILGHGAPARLAFSCSCEAPQQRLDVIECEPAAIGGHSFNVLVGHDYLRGLRALSQDASPARIAAAIIEDLPPESFPSSDMEDLCDSFKRLPIDALERKPMAAGPPRSGPGPRLPKGLPAKLLVGMSRALAVIAELHTASLCEDPELAKELAVVRLLHLGLLWDLDAWSGELSLSRWSEASVGQQALRLALVLAQFQTTWTWPADPHWDELISSQAPKDDLVAYLWHLCRHVAGIGDRDELGLAYAALGRDVDPDLAACLRAYRIELS